MIKKQGIVEADPVDVEELTVNIAPRAKNPIFEDEEKSKQLARLLKSKNPQDLEMANKLIKNMVKQVSNFSINLPNKKKFNKLIIFLGRNPHRKGVHPHKRTRKNQQQY